MEPQPTLKVALVGVLFAAGLMPCPAVAEDPSRPAAASPADAAKTREGESDAVRKAELLASPRWRRAMFELNEWLSTQNIYDEKQVTRIKVDLNRRASTSSSYELEYLLEDLETKFKILDTPEAQEARAWLGQYLSVMADRRREQVLKDVPNIVTMSSAQLEDEIRKIEAQRSSLQRQQAAFDASRQAIAEDHMRTMQQQMAAHQPPAGASFSPYRSGGGGSVGKQPFSDVQVHPSMTVYSGGFMGGGVAINLGSF
jgi:pyruvate/2-oxoglutarate dehydrogenase complex dihydrolipoamide acyltransferase (E2) component